MAVPQFLATTLLRAGLQVGARGRGSEPIQARCPVAPMTGLGHETSFSKRAPRLPSSSIATVLSGLPATRRESPVADMRYTLAANKSHRPGMPFNVISAFGKFQARASHKIGYDP